MNQNTKTCRVELRGVPTALRDRADERAEQLGVSRSRYFQEVVAADLARVGMWLPGPPSVQSVGTVAPESVDNSDQQGGVNE